ncbi:hypothetical protein G6F53_014143 [Rhizopus delemar]|nr:hypothetical protein G6F53_014143 [Rhizopus delemar]
MLSTRVMTMDTPSGTSSKASAMLKNTSVPAQMAARRYILRYIIQITPIRNAGQCQLPALSATPWSNRQRWR